MYLWIAQWFVNWRDSSTFCAILYFMQLLLIHCVNWNLNHVAGDWYYLTTVMETQAYWSHIKWVLTVFNIQWKYSNMKGKCFFKSTNLRDSVTSVSNFLEKWRIFFRLNRNESSVSEGKHAFTGQEESH